MTRPRNLFAISIIVVVNLLVFGSLLILLINGVNNASVSAPSPTARAVSTATLSAPTATSTAARTPASSTPAISISTIAPTSSPSLGVTYPFTYTVQRGDTISTIAARFKVPATKIMEANNISDANFIKIGQVLIIPDPNK